jgi:hypothetical protein
MSKEHTRGSPAPRADDAGERGVTSGGRALGPGHEGPPPQPGQHDLVGLGRLERPTSRLSGVRSNQLSYRPEHHPAGPVSGGKGRGEPHDLAPSAPVRRLFAKGRADGGGRLMTPDDE